VLSNISASVSSKVKRKLEMGEIQRPKRTVIKYSIIKILK